MCELVCVCIINVLFINITMRSKFCSYLCILSRDHYIYMYIYNIHIDLWYKIPNNCEFLLYNIF